MEGGVEDAWMSERWTRGGRSRGSRRSGRRTRRNRTSRSTTRGSRRRRTRGSRIRRKMRKVGSEMGKVGEEVLVGREGEMGAYLPSGRAGHSSSSALSLEQHHPTSSVFKRAVLYG